MVQVSRVVGDYFEDYVSHVFDLVRTDLRLEGNVPDLRARDGSFYVECKAGSFKNCGVIKEKQLFRFKKEIMVRRFYVFVFHPICENMQENYPTARRLRNALSRSSDQFQIYLFPLSIVLAHFDITPKQIKYSGTSYEDRFVPLRYKPAQRIYQLDAEEFSRLGLDPREYKPLELHERVHLLTRQGNLEDKLHDSFNSEALS